MIGFLNDYSDLIFRDKKMRRRSYELDGYQKYFCFDWSRNKDEIVS